MFALLLTIFTAFFAGCSTPANQQEAKASAPATSAAPATTPATTRSITLARSANSEPARVIAIQADGDEDEDVPPMLDEEAIIAQLESLDALQGMDAEIRTAVQEAFKASRAGMQAARAGFEAARPALRWAMANAGNPNVWRMRLEGVEYDDNAAFLGVSTQPVGAETAAQLPVMNGTGLMLTVVEQGSPAEVAGLKQFDVLAKLDDQILVNGEQLAALIRGRKAGDEVKFTFYRGGKEQTASAKLASRRLPKLGPGGARADGGLFNLDDEMVMVAGSPMAPDTISLSAAPGGQVNVVRPNMSDRVVRMREAKAPERESSSRDTMKMNYTTENVAISYEKDGDAVHLKVRDVRSNTTVFDQDRLPTKDELEAMKPEVRADVERMIKDAQGTKTKIRRMGTTAPAAPVPPAPPAPPASPAPEASMEADGDELM